ncbi:hypothetical protein Btru_002991 [Bulinus truncatus]|nr:hypothetical protein Btru_002991 [Bulinus truncatus]
MNYLYTEWIDAVRAMESLTLIFWALPLVIVPVYIYVALGLYYTCTLGTMTAFTLLGAITNIIGVIIFGANIGENSDWKTGWCLIVCVIACGLGVIAFIVFAIACCQRPVFAPERHYISEFNLDRDKNKLYVIESLEPDKLSSFKEYNINHGSVIN